jgi:hypothetical protein
MEEEAVMVYIVMLQEWETSTLIGVYSEERLARAECERKARESNITPTWIEQPAREADEWAWVAACEVWRPGTFYIYRRDVIQE